MVVKQLERTLRVSGMGGVVNTSSEYVVLQLLLPVNDNTMVRLSAREFHVVDKLDCGMLLGNDVASPENMVIDVANETVRMHSTLDANGKPVEIPVGVVQTKEQPVKGRIYLAESATILPYQIGFLKTKQSDFMIGDTSYEFVPKPISLGAQAMDSYLDKHSTGVLFRNNSNGTINLEKDSEIGLCITPQSGSFQIAIRKRFYIYVYGLSGTRPFITNGGSAMQ